MRVSARRNTFCLPGAASRSEYLLNCKGLGLGTAPRRMENATLLLSSATIQTWPHTRVHCQEATDRECQVRDLDYIKSKGTIPSKHPILMPSTLRKPGKAKKGRGEG